jgi:hypothetical protein
MRANDAVSAMDGGVVVDCLRPPGRCCAAAGAPYERLA